MKEYFLSIPANSFANISAVGQFVWLRKATNYLQVTLEDLSDSESDKTSLRMSQNDSLDSEVFDKITLTNPHAFAVDCEVVAGGGEARRQVPDRVTAADSVLASQITLQIADGSIAAFLVLAENLLRKRVLVTRRPQLAGAASNGDLIWLGDSTVNTGTGVPLYVPLVDGAGTGYNSFPHPIWLETTAALYIYRDPVGPGVIEYITFLEELYSS